MINLNGQITTSQPNLQQNRAFLYGDGLFDTLKVKNGSPVFLDLHYFRLMAGMRQLRMEIPIFFNQNFWKSEILKTIKAIGSKDEARVRTSIWRQSEGLYTPTQHDINFLIEASILNDNFRNNYNIGVYKDILGNTQSINNIKTINRLQNIQASIYASENGWDNCFLLNIEKNISSAINGNIFAFIDNTWYTPPLQDGCIKGIIRDKLLGILPKHDYQVKEKSLTASDISHADEIFISNSIVDIQPVYSFKRKHYRIDNSLKIREILNKLS
jgi:branched-chain amino acid aminotransferase